MPLHLLRAAHLLSARSQRAVLGRRQRGRSVVSLRPRSGPQGAGIMDGTCRARFRRGGPDTQWKGRIGIGRDVSDQDGAARGPAFRSAALRRRRPTTTPTDPQRACGVPGNGIDDADAVVGPDAAQRPPVAVRPRGHRTIGDLPVAGGLSPNSSATNRTTQVLYRLPAALLTCGPARDQDTADRHRSLLDRRASTVALACGRAVVDMWSHAAAA